MNTTRSRDISIVGGGIVSICCALALSEAGASVLLIDRDEPGQGTSYGNAGVISPWSVVPQSAGFTGTRARIVGPVSDRDTDQRSGPHSVHREN